MKNVKSIFLALSTLVSASLFAAEAPPAKPAYPITSLAGLPTELKGYLLPFIASGNIEQGILTTAAINKTFYNTINSPTIMLSFLNWILDSSRYTANAIDLAERLQMKKKTLPIMDKAPIVAWIAATQGQLKHGQELFDAAFEDERETVTDLLTLKNIDLNWRSRDQENRTPLLQATRDLHQNIAHQLIKAGANPNIADDQGDTALLFTVGHAIAPDLTARATPLVKALINAGANPIYYNLEGETPLVIAALGGPIQPLKILLEAGANPNFQGKVAESAAKGALPLMSAIVYGRKENVALLLAHGANPNARIYYGGQSNWTPLDEAIERRNTDIVDLLLKGGADPNYHRYREAFTLLMTAVDQGNIEIVKLLLDAGADPDTVIPPGINARSLASSYRGDAYPEIVKLLDAASAKRKIKQEEK